MTSQHVVRAPYALAMSSLDSDEREEQVVSHPLAGVLAKLNRAQEHLEALHSQLPAFLDRKPHRFSAELDPERRRYSMRVTILEDPPLEWSIIVGDIAHNLRSALDHLAWQLVIASGNKPSGGTQFPIFSTEPVSRNQRESWNRMVKGMRDDILLLIKDVQPYKAGDKANEHSLAALQSLSNEDKHRLPVARMTAIQRHDPPTLSLGEIRDVKTREYHVVVGKVLVDGDEVAWADVDITGPDPKMEVQGTFPFEVAFGKILLSGHGLAEIVDHCRKLAGLFEAGFF
jgi:hypothetical protein